MRITILTTPTLALAHLGAMLFEPMNSLCVVYTVEEKPVHVSTCFPSSTVVTIAGCTTTISAATCIDATFTESRTLNPPMYTNAPAPGSGPGIVGKPVVEYTTITTSILTTVCPSPTVFTLGTKTYTVTEATTLTITDCPCTVTRTKYSEEIGMSLTTTKEVATGVSTIGVLSEESKSRVEQSTPVVSPVSTPVVPSQESAPAVEPTSAAFSTYYSPSGPPSSSIDVSVPSSSVSGASSSSSAPTVILSTSSVTESTTIETPSVVSSSIQVDIPTTALDVVSTASSTSTLPPGPTDNPRCSFNGNICQGNFYGDCCSRLDYCGNGTESCGEGCQPEFGTCDGDTPTPSSSVVLFPSSTQTIPSATPSEESCGVTFPPREYPTEIGNGTLTSIPAPAVYTYNENTYSFGFLNTNVDSKAYAAKNPNLIAQDDFAYYQVPTDILPATDQCSNFGYLYHVDSGLCVTANATSNSEGPKFSGSELLLEPCGLCAGKPDIDQLFCTASTTEIANRDRPYQCMFFYGDFLDPLPYYGMTYGEGPDLTIATVNAGPGDCVWLLFPPPTCAGDVDLTNDANNCGACGNVCATGHCTNSICTCGPNSGLCSGTEPSSCGAGGLCYCFEGVGGAFFCGDAGDGNCATHAACATTSDCATGETCAVRCCGTGVCIPGVDTCTNPGALRALFGLDPGTAFGRGGVEKLRI